MTMEDSDPNSSSDDILDWLQGSTSFLPSFLDDPYHFGEINCGNWWIQNQEFDQDVLNTRSTSLNSSSTSATSTKPANPIVPSSPHTSNSSKKRKPLDDHPTAKPLPNPRKNQNRRSDDAEEGGVITGRKSATSKRQSGKTGGGNCNNGNNREGRWAEQLLNPCATAIASGNLTRVQHLLYVLHELASPAGDANHRLAAHGLKALTHHLSPDSIDGGTTPTGGPITFATTKPQIFQRSLMRFDEVSPYFMFPNKIANASILQVLSEQRKNLSLHILDIGVSHGIQWPTLFESLTSRPGGAPPLVRLTVVGATADAPFAIGPPGHSNSPQLLGFAKSMNLNLQINRLDNTLLQNLNTQIINSSPDETLVVCAQFRVHHLSHQNPDHRTEFLKAIKELGPKGVILSENNCECCCINCSDFATGFLRRVEFLWRFLDSTSAAFKGRESDERRVMEGEAAKALTSMSEMNEGREKWCERMRRCGFVGKGYGEDAIDEARALLRKYDSSWEMKVDNRESGSVGLCWKGQPVSFCSLWGVGNESKSV